MLDNGHWIFPEQMGDASKVGFLYYVYDVPLDRVYIGKKKYLTTKKGKQVPSEWRSYSTSSEIVKKLLSARPKDEFQFICIEEYSTPSGLAYAETWTLCYVEAPTTDRFYNKRIEEISWHIRERITPRHKQRLSHLLERM